MSGGIDTATPARRVERVRRPRAANRIRLIVSAPPWVWLTGLVIASALVRFVLARLVNAPWIFIDELIYSELAKSFAASGELVIREQPYERYGPLYPVLISPAWRAFTSIPDAYVAAKAINAVVMSLAAVPAYLLARRVLPPPPALVAAIFALALPSLAYTGTLMTENLAYPLVLSALLALVLTLERPTLVRVLVLLALCLLAFLTRAQAVALVPAVAAAPLLLALFRRRLGVLRAFVVLYGPMAIGGLIVVVVQLGRGRAVRDVFGAYDFVGNLEYSPAAVAKWLLYHLAELDLYVAVVPMAAVAVLLARAGRMRARDQAFLAATAATTAAFLVEVAMFASSLPWVHRLAERSLFYVAPLLLIGLLLWVERGMPRPRRTAAVGALAAAALPAVLPFGSLLTPDVASDTLALVPWFRLREAGVPADAIRALLLAVGVAGAALFLRLPRRLAPVLPAAVLASLVLVLVAVQREFRVAGEGALAATDDRRHPDWIDGAIGPNAAASVLWTGQTPEATIWGSEFFNRAAGRIYDLGAPLPGGLPEEPSHLDRAGVVRDHLDRPVYGPYALADRSLVIAGRPVARSEGGELTLYRVRGPVRAAALFTGRYPGTTWFRPTATYTRLACRSGTLALAVSADPERFPAGQRIEATVDGSVRARTRLAPGETSPLTVPVRARGRCTVTLRAAARAYEPEVGGMVGARYTVLAWR